MSVLNANPQGTLLGYWPALIVTAVLSTCFFGPPLASCYMRRPVLDGIYQVAGLILVVILGISLRGRVRPFTESEPRVGWHSHRILIDPKRFCAYGRPLCLRPSCPTHYTVAVTLQKYPPDGKYRNVKLTPGLP